MTPDEQRILRKLMEKLGDGIDILGLMDDRYERLDEENEERERRSERLARRLLLAIAVEGAAVTVALGVIVSRL